jgi:DNA-binding NtrC family response regulator
MHLTEATVRENVTLGVLRMQKLLPVLIVSCRPENRKSLLKVFDGLPLNTYCASNLAQAREVLSKHKPAVVFCEERLSDGSYRELLSTVHASSPKLRFVVMLCTGEWEEYLEALHLGAAEVIRCPLEPTDIDMALIHTMHGNGALTWNAPAQDDQTLVDRV